MRPRAPGHGRHDESQRGKEQSHSQDCAAGRDLHSGDTPRIQHHESLAVLTAQNPGGLRQRGDHLVDDLAFAARIAIFVRDIDAVTTDEPDTKHNRFHVPHTRRAGRQPRRTAPISGDSRACGSHRTIVRQLERGQPHERARLVSGPGKIVPLLRVSQMNTTA